MKTIRTALVNGEEMMEVVGEDNIGRSTLMGWVTEDNHIFLCPSHSLPKYHPYTGEPLVFAEGNYDQ